MSLPAHRESDLARWDPFRELDDLHTRMSELMEATLGEGPSGLFRWEPPVDIEETDDVFFVEAELPGVQREDVDVELLDNQLHIRGEVKERERVGILRRRTHRTGEFDYRVTLPGRSGGRRGGGPTRRGGPPYPGTESGSGPATPHRSQDLVRVGGGAP